MFLVGSASLLFSSSLSQSSCLDSTMQDLKLFSHVVAARERCLRLINRVARDIENFPAFPTHSDIIALCTQHTTANCTSRIAHRVSLLVTFTGGYLFQYWLAIAGPKWALRIISERLEVTFRIFS